MVSIPITARSDTDPINNSHDDDTSSDEDHEPSRNSGPRALHKVASGSQYSSRYCKGWTLTHCNQSSAAGTVEGGNDIDAREEDEDHCEDGEPVIVSHTNNSWGIPPGGDSTR